LREIQGIHRHVEQPAGIGLAHQADEPFLPGGYAKNRLAAATAGGAIADVPGLEHRDAVAALGQVQRRRQTCNAGANHGHVDLVIAL
jgi:hypothetical protein